MSNSEHQKKHDQNFCLLVLGLRVPHYNFIPVLWKLFLFSGLAQLGFILTLISVCLLYD